ncbi:hypothetical protein [uncultured Clostridium sp.]|uniref:TIGR03943 family putative permease subunit n=1 Tax=uncultured Clostridium sp. TaxID=59620 RepID=UPI0025E627AC|nr:hypothetical protein [uncultured Clostridium sp.]
MKKKLVLALLLSVFSILVACNIDNEHETGISDEINNITINQEGTSNQETSGTQSQSEEDSERESNTEALDEDSETNSSSSEKFDMKNIDVVIEDESFITQMDVVFQNIDSYVGKTMKVEGFIGGIDGKRFKVLRLYDMAHEDHSHEITVGVNAEYDGEIPAEDTWVEIAGVITKGTVDGREQPVIKVKRLEKKFTHGKDKVYN